MSKIVSNALVLGQSLTDTFNFLLDTDVAGALRLRRKSDGSGGNVLAVDVSGNLTANGTALQKMTLRTVRNTTSGTAIDFTSIPSWVKRITVMLNSVSTNGTSPVIVQIGTGGAPTTSGYSSYASIVQGVNACNLASATVGFTTYMNIAADFRYGHVVLTNVADATWVVSGVLATASSSATATLGGAVTLSGVLDMLRLTTVNGTDTFDAGSVNLLLEGY